MTSITWAGPRYVQELGTFLGPENRTQRRCGLLLFLYMHFSLQPQCSWRAAGSWQVTSTDRVSIIIVSTSPIDMNKNMKRNHKDIEWKQLFFETPVFFTHPVWISIYLHYTEHQQLLILIYVHFYPETFRIKLNQTLCGVRTHLHIIKHFGKLGAVHILRKQL